MARSTAEIHADLALTRRLIEHELDAIEGGVPRRWWKPYAVCAGIIIAGTVLSRVPILRRLETSAPAARPGAIVAGAVAVVDRAVAHRRRRPDVKRG
jgi:hypothetical protein